MSTAKRARLEQQQQTGTATPRAQRLSADGATDAAAPRQAAEAAAVAAAAPSPSAAITASPRRTARVTSGRSAAAASPSATASAAAEPAPAASSHKSSRGGSAQSAAAAATAAAAPRPKAFPMFASKEERETMMAAASDPALVLANLLRGGEYHSICGPLLQRKLANVLDIVLNVNAPLSTDVLVMLHAQLLNALLQGRRNPQTAVQRAVAAAFASLEDQADEPEDVDSDALVQAWSLHDVPLIVEALRAVHTRLDVQMRADAAQAAQADTAKAHVASLRASAPLIDDRIALVHPLSTPALQHVRYILHLMQSHFRAPTFWGSEPRDPAVPPDSFPVSTAESRSHADVFHCCIETLIVLLPPLLAQMPAHGETERMRGWLARIVAFEVDLGVQAAEAAKAAREARASAGSSTVVAAAAAGATLSALPSPDSIIRSPLPCCQQCVYLPGRPRPLLPPFRPLSPSGSAALALLVHSFHLQGLEHESARVFHDLLVAHAPTFPAQLSFLAHCQPPLFRMHAVSIAMAMLFHAGLNAILFAKQSGLLPLALLGDAQRLSHDFLARQLQFASQWLDQVRSLYDAAAHREHDQLVALRTKLRDAVVGTAWAAVPTPRMIDMQKSKSTSGATPAATSSRTRAPAATAGAAAAVPSAGSKTQMSLAQGFANQQTADRKRKLNLSPDEQKRQNDDASALRREQQAEAARLRVREESANQTRVFGLLQQHCADLLSLFVSAMAAQLHQHCSVHHPAKAFPGRSASTSAAASAAGASASPSPSQSTELCIPDSQPLSDDEQDGEGSASPAKPRRAASSTAAPVAPSPVAATPPSAVSKRGGSGRGKKFAVLPPLPCQCALASAASTCPELGPAYRELHAKMHAFQSAIHTVPPPKS